MSLRQGLRQGRAEVHGDDELEPHRCRWWRTGCSRTSSAQRANQAWVGDITFIGTDEGWLYLAVVMDLYSRRIVGWSMGERMPESRCAMHCAWRCSIATPRGATDRGSQYCSREHRDLLDQHGLIASMSRATATTTRRWKAGITASRSRRSSARTSSHANRRVRMCSSTSRLTTIETACTRRCHSQPGEVRAGNRCLGGCP